MASDKKEEHGKYSSMTVPELKTLLKERGLPVSGQNKAERIAKLEAFDRGEIQVSKKRKGTQPAPAPKKPRKDSKDDDSDEKAEPTKLKPLQDYLDDGKWKEYLQEEFTKPYFVKLQEFLANEYAEHNCYPKPEEIFHALNATSFEKTRVVIIGQDPYFNNNQAHGLSFSVRRDIAVPPSLNRIYNELLNDANSGFKVKPSHGCLEAWTKQGVLLLNASLSVREGQPNSHAKSGWLQFTDAIIRILNEKADGLIFLLWGTFAQKKCSLVNPDRHSLIATAHPSPQSGGAWNANNKCFSRCNDELKKRGKDIVDWNIPE